MEREFKFMCDRMARLPRDARGFPVPKFVQWFSEDTPPQPTDAGHGVPDFRVVDSRHLVDCIQHDKCWLCGGQLGRHKAFVLGPMCAVNKVNSEPPSHYDCARFAATNCPFLTKPMAKRNPRDLPEHVPAAGLPIDRNPKCCAIWITDSFKVFKPHAGGRGILVHVGPPSRVEFYSEGRPATFEEVTESVDTGLPFLMSEAVREGRDAVKALNRQVETFRRMLCENFNRRYIHAQENSHDREQARAV
jgi:hypothetical protein